ARHQVGQGQRVDVDGGVRGVVGVVGPLGDLVLGVGHYDDVDVAAEALGHDHRPGLVAVALAPAQRRLVGQFAHQDVVLADGSVQRQVDAVHPVGGVGGD